MHLTSKRINQGLIENKGKTYKSIIMLEISTKRLQKLTGQAGDGEDRNWLLGHGCPCAQTCGLCVAVSPLRVWDKVPDPWLLLPPLSIEIRDRIRAGLLFHQGSRSPYLGCGSDRISNKG